MKPFLIFLLTACICSKANSQIIIAGYMNHPSGNEDDNYEYVQFRATENIDFSKTPFSVVTCSNRSNENPNAGKAPDQGWAAGGYRTYKFNLTKGTVAKDDFFYVGGTAKLINGVGSTSIAAAKWIREIDYMNVNGDGFGTARAESLNITPVPIAKTGLMPNNSSPGGIAVFNGTKVTESSVPLDVIFFKEVNGRVFNESPAKGYRIVTNDHYDQAAPFFLQETNTYAIPYVAAGKFIKFRGDYDTVKKAWITPRKSSYVLLTNTSQITEIE